MSVDVFVCVLSCIGKSNNVICPLAVLLFRVGGFLLLLFLSLRCVSLCFVCSFGYTQTLAVHSYRCVYASVYRVMFFTRTPLCVSLFLSRRLVVCDFVFEISVSGRGGIEKKTYVAEINKVYFIHYNNLS